MYLHTIAILGSASYVHLSAVRACVAGIALLPAVQILTRGRGAVDRTAIREAKRHGIPVCLVRPVRHSASEHRLVACADCVHAFWDGHSPGTQHAIRLARATGKPIRVHGLIE